MTDVTAGPGVSRGERGGLVRNWKYVLTTTNPPAGRLDPVSKWLYLTRAGVLPMTLVAAALAGLLAVFRDADVTWGWFALAAAGIVLAHMANNLMNDLFDLEVGTDREDYPRNLYSPHPGAVGCDHAQGTRGVCARGQRDLPRDHDRAHGRARLARDRVRARRIPAVERVHRAAAPAEEARSGRADGARSCGARSWSAACTTRPRGRSPAPSCSRRCPYALLCTTVLMGKHIDKIPWDAADGTHTLPVMLGEARARR